MSLTYLGPLPDADWQRLLAASLDRADEFRVHMPDGDGPLSHGRVEFQALPDAVIRPWTGMRDAVEIAGPMTDAAKNLFRRFEVSIESFDPEQKLWDYQLLADSTLMLSVGDFHDLQVETSG